MKALARQSDLGDRGRTLLVLLTFVVALAAALAGGAAVSWASEGAAHGPDWKEWAWKIGNFAILVILLVKFLNKPLRSFLAQRTELIEKTLKEAQEAKALAEKALAEVQERLRLKDSEINEIISRAQESAKSEEALLMQQGDEMRQRILDQARSNIEQELRTAKEAIRAEAVEVAMELAEKKLREKLTKDEQIRLIEESLKRMEAKN
jgi:F-type H+-transporting ATPase subunit b